MKLVFTIILWVAVQMVSAQQPVFLDSFKPDEKIHDFGLIKEKDGCVEHTFILTNRGTKVVAISDVNSWCGCTTTSFSKKPVHPSKSTQLKVVYNPLHRPGKFSKEIVVMLNGGKNYVRLWVKGDVQGYEHPVTEDYPYSFGEGLFMTNQILPFPFLRKGESRTMTFGIANNTRKSMTISFMRQPKNTCLRMPTTITLKPKEHRTVTATYSPLHERNYNSHILLYPVVNGKKAKPLKVTFFGKGK